MLRSGVLIAGLGLALGTVQAQEGAAPAQGGQALVRRSRRTGDGRDDTASRHGTPSDEEGTRRGAKALR